MSFYSIAPFIREFYPEYYTIERYPAGRCACFCKVDAQWGILGNFGRTPLEVEGVSFRSAEHLFQTLKFTDAEPMRAVYRSKNPKMTAKHWEKEHRRSDWGAIIVDVMKFCLVTKYRQSDDFRTELHRTHDAFIVEDQTTFRKKQADTWGAKLVDGTYVGPNLMGRLLMELRSCDGQMAYSLPDDMLHSLGAYLHEADAPSPDGGTK